MTDPNPYPKADYGRNTNSADVLIIGAGLSGLTVAIDMIRKGNGRNFIIVESGNQLGGTWNYQRYPGCCCDVWSHLYSLSFEPNPNWTRLYPGQEEILDYFIRIAEKYQLYKHIRFSSSVEEARWNDATGKWETKVQRLSAKDAEFGSSYTITSDFLVSAVGQLNNPKYPDFKGLDTFKGKVMHSARWDWDYDLQDKKIGVIGNGSTAAQLIPELAKVSKRLTVFQRTPNWIIPRQDQPISPFMRGVFNNVPLVRARVRAAMMDFRESFYDAVTDAESDISKLFVSESKRLLGEQLPGDDMAELREKFSPQYNIGCKRVVISDDFYPTFRLPNVSLETSSIIEIDPNGITTEGNLHHDLDLIVLATGYKSTQFMYPIKIYGSGGTPLSEIWKNGGTSAYYGMTIPSLPNFSIMYGPNTNLGHNSIILMLEAQSLYINSLIRRVLHAKSLARTLTLSPRPEIVSQYNIELQERLGKSTFADERCNSWYKDELGRITNNWAGDVIEYQKRTSSIEWDKEFLIGGTGAEWLRREGKTGWKRVVEETQISNKMLGVGTVLAVGAAVGGVLWRYAGRVR